LSPFVPLERSAATARAAGSLRHDPPCASEARGTPIAPRYPALDLGCVRGVHQLLSNGRSRSCSAHCSGSTSRPRSLGFLTSVPGSMHQSGIQTIREPTRHRNTDGVLLIATTFSSSIRLVPSIIGVSLGRRMPFAHFAVWVPTKCAIPLRRGRRSPARPRTPAVQDPPNAASGLANGPITPYAPPRVGDPHAGGVAGHVATARGGR
jgi:hypothetical protein